MLQPGCKITSLSKKFEKGSNVVGMEQDREPILRSGLEPEVLRDGDLPQADALGDPAHREREGAQRSSKLMYRTQWIG